MTTKRRWPKISFFYASFCRLSQRPRKWGKHVTVDVQKVEKGA
jgi:hypothetical protein